jgi:hypothetical protein
MIGTGGVSMASGNDGLLRLALRADALASGGIGLLAVVGASALEGLLGVPSALLWPTGAALVLWAAALWAAAARPIVSRAAAWTIVALNALWVVDSLATVAIGWLPLTGLGSAFMVAQAVAVGLFAEAQVVGLRRARSAAGQAV